MIKLIVGLGNPTEKYKNTRHNVGFWMINSLSSLNKINMSYDENFVGITGLTNSFNEENTVILLKPQTFMNDSGLSIKLLADKFNIKPEEILVVHDEIHVSVGYCKLKFGGSSGGNNGLKSIIENIGDQFWRLRIGVGKPTKKDESILDYVLSCPLEEEIGHINHVIMDINLNYVDLLLKDMESFQRIFHNKEKKTESVK